MESKATGKDIILAILDDVQESREPLLYNTLVPSHFDVYLHRDGFRPSSSVLFRIRDEGIQALDRKLAELNKKGLSFLPGLQSSKTTYEAAEKEWSVKFHADENDELAPGDILVDSRLALPTAMEFRVGTKTQRSEPTFAPVGKRRGSANARRRRRPIHRLWQSFSTRTERGRIANI